LFKGYAWYVYAFCRVKNDFRIFRISRIKNLKMIENSYTRDCPENIPIMSKEVDIKTVRVVLKIHKRMAFRVFDEFGHDSVKENEDGYFYVTVDLPDEDWLYGYILSFGEDAEVIEPEHVRSNLKNKLENCLKKYT